jgi:autotransporter-associated beta strand protein
VSGSTLTLNGTGTYTFAGNLTASTATYLALTLSSGTEILNGPASTYTGATAVNGTSTLLVNGALAATPVSVASGATLGGTGTLGGTATFAAGSSTLQLTAGSPLTISGAITLNGSVVVNVPNGASLTAGTYTLLSYPAGKSGNGSITLGTVTGYSGGLTPTLHDTGTALQLQILAPSTTGTVTSTENPSLYTDSVTLSTTVSGSFGTPTGTVQFETNGVPFGSTVTLNGSGVGTLVTTGLAIGTDSITAVYSGDTTYQTSTTGTALSQVVNSHPPIVGAVSITHATGASYKLAFSTLIAAASSPEGYAPLTVTRIDSVTTPSGATLTLDGGSVGTSTMVYVPAAAANNDTFTFDISDGHGGTTTGTVTVHVGAVTGQQDATIRTDGGGGIILTFYGVADTSYKIQTATDPNGTWSDVITLPATNDTGVINYTDSIGAGQSAYFRLSTP